MGSSRTTRARFSCSRSGPDHVTLINNGSGFVSCEDRWHPARKEIKQKVFAILPPLAGTVASPIRVFQEENMYPLPLLVGADNHWNAPTDINASPIHRTLTGDITSPVTQKTLSTICSPLSNIDPNEFEEV